MSDSPRQAATTADLRETVRKQMLGSIGGWSGALITAIPTVVFVVVDVLASLRVAVGAAVGAALLLTVVRLVLRQPVQQALAGLAGVIIAALVAEWTGQARGYFLIGIWTSFLYAIPFGISLAVRRPLVGVIWEFLDPTVPDDRDDDADAPAEPAGPPWYRRSPLRGAYGWATLVATLVFLARGIVQLVLYRKDATGGLAIAKIAMGYPLFVVAALGCFWLVRRARHTVQAQVRADTA